MSDIRETLNERGKRYGEFKTQEKKEENEASFKKWAMDKEGQDDKRKNYGA